jgi:hypothetical protein
VCGDAPAEIQAAFESLPAMRVNRADVHHLFDRVEIGRFLLTAFVAVAARRSPPLNYYEYYVHGRKGRLDRAEERSHDPAAGSKSATTMVREAPLTTFGRAGGGSPLLAQVVDVRK